MKDTGIKSAEILLPKNANMNKWACIACDQFTSEKEYWNQLEEHVKGEKSVLNLVLPEIYLDSNMESRIKKINKNIEEYVDSGVFTQLKDGFILVVRSTPFVKRRIGIVGAVDLEQYDYKPQSKTMVRATEGTIEERIPPRLKIRKNAKVEFPHVMILFDDEKREITEELYQKRNTFEKVYDFELNMGGGHVEGYYIPQSENVIEKFSKLLDGERLIKKYGTEDAFAFAVGDGNHSLATAKTHWENLKKQLSDEELKTHPARYALAEFVNIYDEGIYFEPIFRLIMGANKKEFTAGLSSIDGGKIRIYDGEELYCQDGVKALADGIRAVDNYIKEYCDKTGAIVDYIHGEENLKKLVDNNENSIGILFEKLDKSELFRYVCKTGPFPRKTFSMGEGIEKRYYIEGRRIVK